MNKHTRLQLSLLAIAVAAAYPVQAMAATSAGTAQFTAGEVNIRRSDGTSNPLVKGRELESGQSIVTGANGRAQVRFTDGGLLSLQPNTEFKITNYVDNADPKEDRFLVDLLRGSMRAITGLIGKRNHDNYKVTTSTATIGIRGSGFTAGYNPDGSLSVTTELDAIEVCNAGGCVALTAGESARIFNPNQAPQRVGTRAALPTPGPAQEPTVVGNQTTSDGAPKILPVVIPMQTETKAPTVVFDYLSVGTVYTAQSDGPYVSYPSVYTPGGSTTVLSAISGSKLAGFTTASTYEGGDGFVAKAVSTNSYSSSYSDTSPSTSIGDSRGNPKTDLDYVGWGTWTTGQSSSSSGSYTSSSPIETFNYVVGRQTDPANMPLKGLSGTYGLLGGTAWSSIYQKGNLLADGSNLTVDFGALDPYGSATLNLHANFTSRNPGDVDVYISNSLTVGGSALYSGVDYTNTNAEGFFIGDNATRAALVYSSSTENAGQVSGSAAFQQTSLLPTVVTPPADPVVSYSNLAVVGRYADTSTGSAIDPVLASPSKLDSSDGNKLVEFTLPYEGPTFKPSTSVGTIVDLGSVGTPGTGDFIGWGRWTSGTLATDPASPTNFNNLHYIVGEPTVSMPTSGTFNYSTVIGGTLPTSNYTGQSSNLVSASLTAVFDGMGTVGASVTTGFNPTAPLVGSAMPINGSTFGNGTTMQGFFSGANAARAGLSYTGPVQSGFGTGTFSGVVVLGQTSP